MPQEIVGSPVIGYLGSLDRARGLEFLLEALVRVRDRFPDASLLFIGDATEDVDRRWLKAKAEEFNLGGAIVWTGWLPRGNAWEYLRHADIAVSLVPRGELFDVSSPTKVVEYLALGLPVVANDLPDQQEVLSESGAGFSVESKVPEFADAIVRILQDPALSAAMRAAGPPYVRARRSYAVIGARVAEVYSRLLSRSGEPGGK
jgi:glycosyltransferase involved in cell wall biosynthesis